MYVRRGRGRIKFYMNASRHAHGLATISRLLKITGLFCKRALQKRLYSVKRDLRNMTIFCKSYLGLFVRTYWWYGVATISRLFKIIGLFCRISSRYRALLQKRPVILRSLLIVATPYVYVCLWVSQASGKYDYILNFCDVSHTYM